MNGTAIGSSIRAEQLERAIPSGPWLRCIATALCATLVFIGLLEARLAERDVGATVSDSAELWLTHRLRAGQLGSKAIALVGASRMQLAIDLSVLDKLTGKVPVQLAVDGASFIPVLQTLADDASFRGTVIVSYLDHALISPRADQASELAAAWRQAEQNGRLKTSLNFDGVESQLTRLLRSNLRSYADGARPLTSLTLRTFGPQPTPQYLITLPSRARKADYRMVSMPGFYFSRVLRDLGGSQPVLAADTPPEVIDAALSKAVQQLEPAQPEEFAENTDAVAQMVQAIVGRGGQVYFVVFPTSGYIREIEHRRYPRTDFWDRFARGRCGCRRCTLKTLPNCADSSVRMVLI